MERYEHQDAHSNGRPPDFAFRFKYQAGTSSPDGYYEYDVEVAPDGSGEIRFRRDYEANHPDEFVAIFDPEEEVLERIYRLMLTAGFCEPVWQPPRRKEVPGGSVARLDITCGGNFFEITPARFDSLGDFVDAIYEGIKGLVPEAIWQKIEKQFPRVD